MSVSFWIAVAITAGVSVAGASTVSSIAVPDGEGGPAVLSTSNNSVLVLDFGYAAAKAQSDYGVLRNYVYSNLPVGIPTYESQALTSFNDFLTVVSPQSGMFVVTAFTEGAITYSDVAGNSQSFLSQWVLQNRTNGSTSSCLDQGTYGNVPGLPLVCQMQVTLNAGTSRIYLSGSLRTYTLGLSSATSMDLFHTSSVTGLGVTDGQNPMAGVSIVADSGTGYPELESIPEPATLLTMGAGLALVFMRSLPLGRRR